MPTKTTPTYFEIPPKYLPYVEEMGTSVGSRLRESQHPDTDFGTLVRKQVTGNVQNGVLYKAGPSLQGLVIEEAYKVAMGIIEQPRPVAQVSETEESEDFMADLDF